MYASNLHHVHWCTEWVGDPHSASRDLSSVRQFVHDCSKKKKKKKKKKQKLVLGPCSILAHSTVLSVRPSVFLPASLPFFHRRQALVCEFSFSKPRVCLFSEIPDYIQLMFFHQHHFFFFFNYSSATDSILFLLLLLLEFFFFSNRFKTISSSSSATDSKLFLLEFFFFNNRFKIISSSSSSSSSWILLLLQQQIQNCWILLLQHSNQIFNYSLAFQSSSSMFQILQIISIIPKKKLN